MLVPGQVVKYRADAQQVDAGKPEALFDSTKVNQSGIIVSVDSLYGDGVNTVYEIFWLDGQTGYAYPGAIYAVDADPAPNWALLAGVVIGAYLLWNSRPGRA